MSAMKALTLPVYGLLVLTPMTIAFGQVLFKQTGIQLADKPDAPFYSILFSPVFLVAVALYGIATLAWVYVLKMVPLSMAYSFMALTFVLVPLMAAFFLKEPLTVKYAIGACLIIAGLFVVQS
ncbi:EamA family transporter [Hyphomonas sp.]|jgi:drug/metabolite transporter (DMT)-like permease|uniref:EamA family transporter n=1 Tax=Hyphomonas sp. TaxID=87 RepID=UPI0030F53377